MTQRFNVGAEVLVRERKDNKGWARGRVIATRLVAPDARPWRHERHTVEQAAMGYTVIGGDEVPHHSGRYGRDIDEVGWEIVAAEANQRRDRWTGEVTVRSRSQVQLLCHDFDLDGTDTDLVATLEGTRLSGTGGTEHAEHARLVIEPRPGQRLTINVLELLHLAARVVRD